MHLHGFVSLVLTLSYVWTSGAQTGGKTPALHYERPSGFGRGGSDGHTWIADNLDGVIHVYPFRAFHGDLAREFRRTMFRDWILTPYQEDKALAEPTLTPLNVRGADEAIAASFNNSNGGVPRQHLRVAVLASGRVALVDISTNSPDAFERNRAVFSRLVDSLQVVERHPPAARMPPR